MVDRLKGKVAVVTGAAPRGEGVGNGMATAILFAREGAKVVDAGGHRDPRHPMGERHGALVLVDAGEHFQEDFLAEILLGHPPGKVGTHNPNDHRMKMFHKFAGRRLIAFSHAIQTASQIERLVVGHRL